MLHEKLIQLNLISCADYKELMDDMEFRLVWEKAKGSIEKCIYPKIAYFIEAHEIYRRICGKGFSDKEWKIVAIGAALKSLKELWNVEEVRRFIRSWESKGVYIRTNKERKDFLKRIAFLAIQNGS
jgi:hypothetical protein